MRRFAPPVPRQTAIVRLFSGICFAVTIAFTTLSAQIPGRNVNMVAGNTWPDGDPFLQRQNEPSIAASTRNPLHLLAGANDYRTVDLPGLASDETGDAWLGLFKSYDGGQRWTSTLLPGYPQDHSTLGTASPIHGYGAGADPVLRAGTNGMIYYAGLAFDRADPATPDIPGKSAVFVARYIDNNNKEAGDTFEYLGTRAIQTQPGGVGSSFLDKPWIAVDIPRDTTRCTIVTAGEKGPITQSIPAGPVYIAYVNRSSDNKGPRYDIMFSRSTDCGATFSQPVQINSSGERANQGAALAIDPRNGNVYIAYRQFDLSDQHKDDAIMVAKYIPATGAINPPGFAHKFAKPKKGQGKGLNLEQFYKRGGVNRAVEAAGLAPLDQSTDTGTIRFRTNAYPSATVDENGRLYLVWAQRGYDPASPDEAAGSARILIATSTDGKTFTTAKTVASGEPGQKGHQLMPTITYSGGKLMLIYYDIRETRAQSFTKYIDDKSSFQHTTPEATGLRHTVDLRASMGTPGADPVFANSVRVSDYLEGPRYQGGPNVPWQVNPPNLPMFAKGTAPFIGDYVDITSAPNFVLDAAGRWGYNNAASATPPIFHATWTDNRDVRVPLEDKNGDGNPWNDYTPPGMDGSIPSVFDPSQTVPMCVPGNAGSRNQNVYTARITGGLLAGSPGNNKRLGYRQGSTELMERRFVVFVQNTADEPVKRFRLTIGNQPVGGRASWDQFSPAPVTVIEADVPRRSTASRTVYATSTDPHAQITINIAELTLINNQWVVKNGGLASSVLLNPDIDNPDIDNPDIDNPDIDNPDIDNAEIFNPDIDNPDIDNPDIDNPDIDNPDIDNPDIDNVEVANPDIDNPDIDNPDIDNPDIDNPDIDNPDIDNPDIDNASLMSDVTWNLRNTGNTTAAYNVNLFFAQQQFDPAISTQLILYRTYKTPVVQNCVLKAETRNVLVANVPNPHLVSPGGTVSDPNDPAATNATIYLAPGESARITLRVFDPHPDPAKIVTVTNADGTTGKIVNAFVPNEDVTPVVQQQAVDTENVDEGQTEPPIVVQFPAPQAVNESVSTAEQTPVTINVLANDSTAFGSTKIFSLHPDGMATHSGGSPGEIAYQPSTGFVYTSRGIIDPATDTLVGRLMSPASIGAAITTYADPVSGITFQRVSSPAGIVLAALDTRPDSATFHQFLPMPSLPESVWAVAIDSAHRRLYAVHSTNITLTTTPSTVSIIDINASNAATFLKVIGTVSLPVGIRAQSAAVNSRTQKVYVATVNVAGSSNAGLYVMDGSVPAPTATRIAGTTNAWSVAVNEGNNQAFASTAPGPNFALYVVDGASNAMTIVNTPVAMRFSNAEERLVIHYATGKVYMRLQNSVVVIDGQRGSPTRNQVVQIIPVAEDNNNAELAIDQDLGLIISVGSQEFKVQVIDVSDDAVVAEVPLNLAPTDVTIDQVHHKAFVSASLTSVQVLDLAAEQIGALIPVFIESGGQIVNPVTNKAYTGLFTTGGAIGVFSGSGFQGYIANVNPQSRYLFSERFNTTNQFFIVSNGSPDGTSINPGTVTVIDGATDTKRTDVTLTTPPNPFGIGINQATGKIYVGSTGASNIQGGVRIFDGNNLAAAPVDATYEGGLGTGPTNFPISNPNSIVGASRFLVPNPATGNVYVGMVGGTSVSVAYLDAANILHPLDGKAGTPFFIAQDTNSNGTIEASESWGRALLIRANATANIIYVSFMDGTGMVRLAAIDGNDHHLINMIDHLSHSNRHTPSNVIVNETTQKLYVADYSDSQVGILDAATLNVETVVNVAQGPSAMAYNQTANRLYVSSIDAKTLTALDGTTLATLSTVRLPLVAYFINVDEVEGRLYTSGGDAADESGIMVITDILGKLGTNVSVASVGSASNGAVTLNADYSVTYVPNDGFSGVDHFNYTIQAPTGTAIGTVTVNVVGSTAAPIAFGDAYSTTAGQQLVIGAPGVLANDATGSSATTASIDLATPNGSVTLNPDGSFTYQPAPGFTGVDYFQYHAVTDSLGPTNIVNVTISVNPQSSFVVTNTNDSGTGSLRQVLTNALVEPNSVVTFNIPGAGVHTISPAFALPTITTPMTINGYSQPGSSPNTGAVAGTDAVINIAIDGAAITSTGISGLSITGGGTTVKGLAIGRFTGQGILLDVVGGNVIEGNFIGTDATGMIGRPNGNGGIQVQSGGNMIGGNTAGARNIISGNTNRTGVNLTARVLSGILQNDASGSVVAGNLIGTNAAGTGALPNGNGVNVQVSNVRVGGYNPPERNVIAGNANNGISSNPVLFDVDGTGPTPTAPVTTPDHLQVIGNYIGLTAAGNAPLGNSTGGATIVGANSTVANNVISGNGNLGLNVTVTIDGSQTAVPFASVLSEGHHTLVIGNIIGLDATGSNIIANTGNGVSVAAHDVTIGGANAFERNVISGNTAAGISLNNSTLTPTSGPNAGIPQWRAGGDRAAIRGNYIGLSASGTTKLANTSAAMFISTNTVMVDANYVVLGNANGINLNRGFNGATVVNQGGNSTVQNNVIGLLTNGARSNGGGSQTLAISVTSANNVIYGNTVAGNGQFLMPAAPDVQVSGINVNGSAATGNDIRNNIVGTNANGDAGLGNTNHGIYIQDASGNNVGGYNAGDRNVVSGNARMGITVQTSPTGTADGNIIWGNYIGLKPDGQTALGNGDSGVLLFSSVGGQLKNTKVGGANPGERNVIAGNTIDGVSLNGPVFNNSVIGNYIGVAADGTTARGNGGSGVFLGGGAHDNIIGGASAADGNLVANQAGTGVGVQASAVNNRILSNRIFSNGGLGIDLGFNGVTPNDAGDGDGGANNQQNFPVITALSVTPSASELQGTLESTPNTVFTLQLFRNTTCDASGNGEGAELRDTQTMGTGPTGIGFWTLTTAGPGGGAYFYSVTATDPNGNTSEFSSCMPAGTLVVTNNADTGPGSLRQAILDANAGPGGNTIRFALPASTVIQLNATSGPLPTILKPMVIDGTTQPGYVNQPIVEVRGISNTAYTGLNINASNVTIRGLKVTNFLEGVFAMQTLNAILIENNFISGNFSGINFRASTSTIRQNVISGNTGAALTLLIGASFNLVDANKIGVAGDGTTAMANSGNGITLYDGSNNAVIQSNTIANNGGWGVDIQHSGVLALVQNTSIQNNRIGMNDAFASAGNGLGGISLNNAPGTLIGTTTGNGIQFNNGPGVKVMGTSAAVIRSNTIADNAGLGIDLNGDGVTANDGATDTDSGPNDLQNFPVLNLANNDSVPRTNVTFDPNLLNPGNAFTIDFYSSPSCDLSGYGEGRSYEGTTTVTGGQGSTTFMLNNLVPLGFYVTATATDAFGHTSEFSNCVPATLPPFWAASGTGTTTVTDYGGANDDTSQMTYQNNGVFSGNWAFSTTATANANLVLDYNWQGFHSFFQATAGLQVFVNRGGVDVFTSTLINAGPENCPPCTPPSSGFNYTGTTNVNVQPGDTYGFRLTGSHLDGTLVLTGTFGVTRSVSF